MSLYFTKTGQGEPLLLLHGNGESGEYFTHQINYFSSHYCVIAPDMRGHGSSPRGSQPLSLNGFVEDIKNFIDEQNLGPVHLLGFSDGANVALLFALKYQKLVKSLIINGGNLKPNGVKRSTQFPIEIGYRIASRFQNKSEKSRLKAEKLGLMVNEPNINEHELLALNIPVLVIAGTRDMIKRAHTERIAKWIPHAKTAFIRGGHFIAAKNSEKFNQVVHAFLTEINSKSDS